MLDLLQNNLFYCNQIIDVLVFTEKIGAGSSIIGKMIIDGMEHVLKGTKIIVVKTDEELQIAKEIIPYLENKTYINNYIL